MNTGYPQATARQRKKRARVRMWITLDYRSDRAKNTRPTRNKLTQRDRLLYKTKTALTRHSRRSRSAGISGHLRPESSVILSGIHNPLPWHEIALLNEPTLNPLV